MSISQDRMFAMEFHLREFRGVARGVLWASSMIQNGKVNGTLRPSVVEVFRNLLHETLGRAERVRVDLSQVVANIADHIDESSLKLVYIEIASCELMLVEGTIILAEISSMPPIV